MADLSSKAKALSIIPHITGGLSILGSGYIATCVLRKKKKHRNTYHRILLVMSLCDIVSSLAYFCSTWSLPQGPNQGWGDPYHYAAVGNERTCTAQGVGIQFGVVTAFYNVALSIQFLLIVRYNVSERDMRKKFALYLLLVPLLLALALTLPGIFLKMYANSNLWCWIATNWNECPGDREECVRKGNIYRFIFYYVPLWVSIFFVIFAQMLLWKTVKRIETKSRIYRCPRNSLTSSETRSFSAVRMSLRRMSTLSSFRSRSSLSRRLSTYTLSSFRSRSSLSQRFSMSNLLPKSFADARAGSNTCGNNEGEIIAENEEGLSDLDVQRIYQAARISRGAFDCNDGREDEEQQRRNSSTSVLHVHCDNAEGREMRQSARKLSIEYKRASLKSRRAEIRRCHRQSRRIAIQAMFYVGIFIFTWLPYTITSLTMKIWFKPSNNGFWMLLVIVICQPSQGFLNCFAYNIWRIRRLCKKLKKRVRDRGAKSNSGSSDGVTCEGRQKNGYQMDHDDWDPDEEPTTTGDSNRRTASVSL